jgi:hypothetical protein
LLLGKFLFEDFSGLALQVFVKFTALAFKSVRLKGDISGLLRCLRFGLLSG